MGMSSYIFDCQDAAEHEAREKAMNHIIESGADKDYCIDWVEDNWPEFLTGSQKQLWGGGNE